MASNASYKGRRMRLPRLCNQYAALQESMQYTFDNDAKTLVIPATTDASMNQLIKFEPFFRPGSLINTSPLCLAMFNRYQQFRIRKVCVRLTEAVQHANNMGRSDIWVYWVPNHSQFDEEEKAGTSFSNVTDLAEASRIQYLTSAPGRGVQLEVVPQVIYDSSVTIGGVSSDIKGDGKMPWMDTSPANRDSINLRMPIFYFRRPLLVGSNVPVHDPQYQVVLVAIVEFRNLSDDN